MKRTTLLAILLAGAGFFACSGPTPPSGDAGFFGTGTGGFGYGTGGSYGTGGFNGTGGSFGGTNPTGGAEGGRDPGGRRRDAGPSPDATPMPACAAGTMDEAACMTPDATCLLLAGDAGRTEICTCRERRGERTWRCERP